MKQAALFWIAWLLTFTLGAQSIICGRIIDAKGKNAISSAVVFLEGTTLWTTTDEEGAYHLKVPSSGIYTLTVSHVVYEEEKQSLDFAERTDSIFNFSLRRKTYVLDEVSITEKVSDIKERYKKRFWRTFLGEEMSERGDLKVLNDEVVRFSFDEKERVITVLADEPIEVENRYLGYKVRFALSRFTYSFRAHKSYTVGSSFYTELEPSDSKEAARWEEHRRDTYHGSVLHFGRALYQNNWADEGFQIFSVVTDSFQIEEAGRQSVPPRKRKKEPFPSSAFYYSFVRTLLLRTTPLTSDSLFLAPKTYVQRIRIPNDLFVIYRKERGNFMKDYYYKGITSRKRSWVQVLHEEMKPTKQFYLTQKASEIAVYKEGYILPSNAWNVTFKGIKYSLPFNYWPEQ